MRHAERHVNRILLVCIILLGPTAVHAQPKADIHLHYKWNQTEVTSIDQALSVLEENDIQLAGVIGTPPELALALHKADPKRVFAWYGVYQQPGDWSRWARDKTLPARIRHALDAGGYAGIGELHLVGGFTPKWDTPVIQEILSIAKEKDIPVLVHVEFSRADYLIGLCQSAPEVRLLLAHAGAPMPVGEVRRALSACPNLWWELSARDPLRYVSSPIVDGEGALKKQWRDLIHDYSERLMLGSDPVWPVEQLNPWDEADTGWYKIGSFWQAHEQWLSQLPAPIADAIRLTNAQRFFGGGLK